MDAVHANMGNEYKHTYVKAALSIIHFLCHWGLHVKHTRAHTLPDTLRNRQMALLGPLPNHWPSVWWIAQGLVISGPQSLSDQRSALYFSRWSRLGFEEDKMIPSAPLKRRLMHRAACLLYSCISISKILRSNHQDQNRWIHAHFSLYIGNTQLFQVWAGKYEPNTITQVSSYAWKNYLAYASIFQGTVTYKHVIRFTIDFCCLCKLNFSLHHGYPYETWPW